MTWSADTVPACVTRPCAGALQGLPPTCLRLYSRFGSEAKRGQLSQVYPSGIGALGLIRCIFSMIRLRSVKSRVSVSRSRSLRSFFLRFRRWRFLFTFGLVNITSSFGQQLGRLPDGKPALQLV